MSGVVDEALRDAGLVVDAVNDIKSELEHLVERLGSITGQTFPYHTLIQQLELHIEHLEADQ